MAADKDATMNSILKQVEFYFGNSNLPRDKFLRGLTEQTPEGWVLIETVASFKRMQEITKDLEVVVEALKKSEYLLTVSEDGKMVRRTTPLNADMAEISSRSVYAKGFPLDSTQKDLEAFWNAHGTVKCVRMRRYRGKKKDFKGSVFVEFATKEEAAKVAAATIERPKPEGEDKNLKIMFKDEYAKIKAEEYGTKPDIHKQKKEKPAPVPEPKPEDFAERECERDLLVKFDQLEEASREDLRDSLQNVGCRVAYTDYSRGQVDGFVRLNPDSKVKAAEAAKALTEAKAVVGAKVGVYTALAGEDEQKYWVNVWMRQAERKRKGPTKHGSGAKRQRR